MIKNAIGKKVCIDGKQSDKDWVRYKQKGYIDEIEKGSEASQTIDSYRIRFKDKSCDWFSDTEFTITGGDR